MNETLKQRLVGALILVALGVIFWPIIFVQPGSKDLEPRQQIPPRPEVSTAPMPTPSQEGLRGSPDITPPPEMVVEAVPPKSVKPKPVRAEPVAQTKPAAPARTTRTEPPAALALDSDGVPVAWILQVVSVSSADKAEDLRQRLLAMDQKAFVKKVPQGNKVLYRVYLGPKFEQAKLEKLQPKIDAEFRVTSRVVRYVP